MRAVAIVMLVLAMIALPATGRAEDYWAEVTTDEARGPGPAPPPRLCQIPFTLAVESGPNDPRFPLIFQEQIGHFFCTGFDQSKRVRVTVQNLTVCSYDTRHTSRPHKTMPGEPRRFNLQAYAFRDDRETSGTGDRSIQFGSEDHACKVEPELEIEKDAGAFISGVERLPNITKAVMRIHNCSLVVADRNSKFPALCLVTGTVRMQQQAQ
jgi:hypothetical protein